MNPNLLIREAQSSEYETVANLTMAAYRPLFTELDLPEDLVGTGQSCVMWLVALPALKSSWLSRANKLLGVSLTTTITQMKSSLVIPGIVRDFEFWRQILSCKVVALEKP